MEHGVTDRTMKHRHRASIAALLIVTATGAGSCGSPQPARATGATMTAQDQQARIDAALPAGTPAAAVTAWLDDQKVEHSGYVENERVINAIWRDVERKGVTSRSIRADFHFSPDRKLEKLIVRDAFTGP
jgi:hypothetical protein